MAGLDYVSCTSCGRRLAYDGDARVRWWLDEYEVKGLHCDKCYRKLVKRITKLEKRLDKLDKKRRKAW